MPKITGVLALVLAAALLSGCAERTYSDKTLVEWSRGKQVGVSSASEPVAMAVTPSGDRIVLAWPESPKRGIDTLHLVVLDGQGKLLTDRELPLTASEPSALRLALTVEDRLHLTWIDKSEGTPSLQHALMSLEGEPVGPQQRLSSLDFRVNGQDITRLPSGDLLAVWSNRRGLVAARITEEGTVRNSAVLEAPDSFGLDLQIDETGLVHITWQQRMAPAERKLSYATLETPKMAFSRPWTLGPVKLRVASSRGGSATELSGPVITLDPRQVIIAWAITEIRGSNDRAYYVNLPRDGRQAPALGDEQAAQPTLISLPPAYQPAYEAASGPLPYQQLAAALPSGTEAHPAHLRSAPALVAGKDGETPLGINVWVRTAWSTQLQPALAILEEGTVKGFQVAGWSRYPSLHPSLAADANRNLYLTWIDAAGKTFPVYLATTAPSLRAKLDEVRRDDLRVGLERLLGRMVSALGLVLFGLSWLILPGFCLIVALFVVREDSLDTSRGKALLFLMIGVHWAGKFLFTSGILASLPRMSDLPLIFPLGTLLFPSTWAYLPNKLQLPALIAPVMPYLVPTLTLVAGALVTRLAYLNRSKYPSLVPAYAILAAVDLFLALQIYALAYYDPVNF